MSTFQSFSLGHIISFKSVTLHNGSTRCATGWIPASPTLRDTRVLLPNGTIFDPNQQSGGSYLVPTTSQTLESVTQSFLYKNASPSALESAFNEVRSQYGFRGVLTARTLNNDTFYCEAQLAGLDTSQTTIGIGQNGAILFSATWYMMTDWEG